MITLKQSTIEANLQSEFNIINDLVATKTRELLKKREDQILERLSQLGYTFSNEIEKQEFAKARLTIHTYKDKPQWRELYLDKTHLIASWWETVDFYGDTIVAGKHPSGTKQKIL